MPNWPIETWVGLATFIAAILLTALTAYWQRKKPEPVADDDHLQSVFDRLTRIETRLEILWENRPRRRGSS